MLDVILEPGLARNPVGTEDSLRIACLGECMIEMAPAREAHGLFRLGAAGDSFNTAVHLARLEGGDAVTRKWELLGESAEDREGSFLAP